MRIKVETAPPLPPVKAWYSVHTCTTISDLKTLLCHELQQFRDSNLAGADITLLLEDFELLESSPIDVIRDGDLILIKRTTTPQSNKRKAAIDESSSASKRAKHSDPVPRPKASATNFPPASTAPQRSGHVPQRKAATGSDASTSSSTDASSSSESDSDSSSESDDSSSDSDSDSSSESGSSSAPSIQPTRFARPGAPHAKPIAVGGSKTSGRSGAKTSPLAGSTPKPTAPPVPPGLGKPATHSRNARRRLKKMYEKQATSVEPTSVNEIPLGTKAPTGESAPPEPEPANGAGASSSSQTPEAAVPVFMMASLQNKNKKKGFKNALTSGVPAKILFENVAEPSQADVQVLREAMPFAQAANHELSVTYARLIPPSEKQENGQLPANMFVTSVDVEEGLHPKRKKKKDKAPAIVYEEPAEEDIKLPYDDPEDVIMQTATAFDRTSVEAKWSTFDKIADQSQLRVGSTIGWKALGINPATFTPEMLLTVGRVVKCDEQLTVEPYFENGPAEISFGGLIVAEDGENMETHEWKDVYQGDWRVVL